MSKLLLTFLLGMLFSITSAANVNLAVNGKISVDAIVIPDKPYPSVVFAAEEMAYHLGKVFDASLSVISEKKIDKSKSYIFLGACKYSKSLGVNSRGLASNAALIVVKNNNIFIVGTDSNRKDWNNEHGDRSSGTLFGVYAFLEKKLNIRWIWPGELGEIIPKLSTLTLPEQREVINPKLRSSRWRTMHNAWLWRDPKNYKKFYKNQNIWLKRNRFSHISSYGSGHAFSKYFRQYGKSNPEYFNLLPDNTRRPNPYDWSKGNPSMISICPTSKGLVNRIVDNWNKQSRPWLVNLNENDTSGDCVCDNCLRADNSPTSSAVRRAKATIRFNKKEKYWSDALGSVSDRYAKFYLAVQKKINKLAKGRTIMGLIYANYSEPPSKKIKLNDRIILRFCPPVMYPFSAKKIADYKRIWAGWASTGAKLMFRPNFTLLQCFPIAYEDVFYDLFTFAYKHGMVASDMDSLTGHYGVQSLTNYVIASLNHRPTVALSILQKEFYSAFGKAAKDVEDYHEYMKRISMRPKLADEISSKGNEGGNFSEMFLFSGIIFSMKELKQGQKILERAASISGLSDLERRRIKFLQVSLQHAILMVKAQHAYKKYKVTRKLKGEFATSLQKIQKYRAEIEDIGAINIGRAYHYENRHWPWAVLPSLIKGAKKITKWRAVIDSDNIGEKETWFKTPSNVVKSTVVTTHKMINKQSIAWKWKKKNPRKAFKNVWYFTSFKSEKKNAILYFMAVDGATTIYLNGKQIYYRRAALAHSMNRSWRDPFYVPIPPELLKENNKLVVKVSKRSNRMGIYHDVYLLP